MDILIAAALAFAALVYAAVPDGGAAKASEATEGMVAPGDSEAGATDSAV